MTHTPGPCHDDVASSDSPARSRCNFPAEFVALRVVELERTWFPSAPRSTDVENQTEGSKGS